MPSNDLPDLNKFNIFQGFDKVVHIGIFFVLTVLLYWESALKSQWSNKKPITIVKVIVTTVIFAYLTEEAQKFVSTRSADIYDFYADCLGIAMATFTYILLYRPNKSKV